MSPRIDLPEDYAVRFARQSIRDALMSHGEEALLVHMYHVTEDEGTQPRCPSCYDDVYKQGDRYDCPNCYGTTFQGGVKDIYRAWAMFTDAQDVEDISKRGVWHPVARTLQTEHIPDLWKRDYVVRVARWSPDHRVLEIEGIYVFDDVTNESLRTGQQAGQIARDNVGQRANLNRISTNMPIFSYPIIGRRFARFDGKVR